MSQSDAATGDRKAFRRNAFTAAAVILVLVLGVVVVAIFRGGGSNATPNTGQGSTAPAAADSPSAAHAAHAGCGPAGGSRAVPTTPPAVTWTLWQGQALPSSTTDGPAKVSGPAATCYAHTPVGALIAAVQIDLRVVASNNTDAIIILTAQAEPGAGRDRDISLLQSGNNAVAPTPPYQVAGFQFISYSPQRAVISLAMRQANGVDETASYVIDWHDGDWKARLSSDGSISPPFAALSSLSGYIPWAGVS